MKNIWIKQLCSQKAYLNIIFVPRLLFFYYSCSCNSHSYVLNFISLFLIFNFTFAFKRALAHLPPLSRVWSTFRPPFRGGVRTPFANSGWWSSLPQERRGQKRNEASKTVILLLLWSYCYNNYYYYCCLFTLHGKLSLNVTKYFSNRHLSKNASLNFKNCGTYFAIERFYFWLSIFWSSLYAKISLFKRLLFSQVIHQETATLKSKLELYFHTSVNIVDSFANAIALIGFVLRFFEVTWEAARVLYCINFVIFSFRLFRVYFVSGYLGPKIIMIKRMVSQFVSLRLL